MKTVEVANKRVYEPGLLKAALESAGFAVVNVVAKQTPPTVYVYLQDAETKDPIATVVGYKNPAKLVLSSNKPAGVGGVPEAQANGVDKHTLTISKVDRETGQVVAGAEQLQVIPSQMVVVVPSKPSLSSGSTTAVIGPSSAVGELLVRVCDPAGKIIEETIRVRFA